MKSKFLLRFSLYIIGIACLALGGVLAINSRLGVSPVNLIQLSLSYLIGSSLGFAAFISFVTYVILQALLLKKDFKPIQILQILFAVLFGFLLQFFNNSIQLENLSLTFRVSLVFISILVIALGIFLTVTPRLIPMAPDGMAGAIAFKLKKDFGKGKLVFDVIIVVTSAVILFVTNSGFEDIGIGTILSAILVGKVIVFVNSRFKEKLEAIIF